MAILSFVANTTGQVGIDPRIVKIISNDVYATVTAENYLSNYLSDLDDKDIVALNYNDGNGGTISQFFTLTIVGKDITLVPGQLTPSSTAGQTISVETSSATPGTLRAIRGLATGEASVQTSGNLVGVRGEVDMVGASGGFFYGTQGKVIPTGTLSGSAWIAGVFGQFDLSAATLTAAQTATIWGDYGTTATAGTYSGARGIAMTNTTAAKLNAQLYLYGGATNLLELVDNNALVGATYFVAAGTSAGSAGDTTKCNASHVLKITVNGTNYWLPLFASNS
jgi:hypothetical protein